jgi:hypothetical protein
MTMDTGHDATKDVEQADAANAEMVAVASVEEPKPAEAAPAPEAPVVVPEVRLDPIPDPVQPSIAAVASARARSFAARARRMTPIAATIALSAALGGIVGSLAATGFVHVAAPAAARGDDTSRATIARIEADLFALKSGMEASSKAVSTHFAKIAERLDRGERAQIDPTLKLATIAEGIDRIEKRATPAPAPAAAAPAAAAQPNHDTTGSIAAPAEKRPGPTIIDSWRLRRVRYGAAVIEGKLGVVEVEPGDTIPGLGRIENIKRQDGRWVVVTNHGLIVDR